LGALGLGLPALYAGRSRVQADSRVVPPGFGRARSCIVLFMFGAPAHQDIWDLKPRAPLGIRGEFQPIATSVPDLLLGEHVPRLALRADRYAIIRSVTHPDNTHTVAMHYMLSGVRHARPATNPQNAPDDFPCFGAVVSHASRRGLRRVPAEPRRPLERLVPAVSLNAPANQVSANNHIFPGFFGGVLGSGCDPLFVPKNCDALDFRPLPVVDQPDRLLARQALLAGIERQLDLLERAPVVRHTAAEFSKAFSVLTSREVRDAFALEEEPAALRDAYGKTPFGQGCLLARRLVERGVPLVTVNWERDDAFWDTHANNFKLMKESLCPNMDRGLSALLDDLQARGLLQETLVVCLGEFGRTPQINANAGRDHWAACNSVVLAGAGVPGGAVYGASDRLAAWPKSNPVTPEDLAATIYHLLGIDPGLTLRDALDRPYVLSTGTPIAALL